MTTPEQTTIHDVFKEMSDMAFHWARIAKEAAPKYAGINIGPEDSEKIVRWLAVIENAIHAADTRARREERERILKILEGWDTDEAFIENIIDAVRGANER